MNTGSKLIITLGLGLALSACMQPPKPLRGQFSEISPLNYQKQPVADLMVRWTGFVVDVENSKEHSCLTIVAKVPDQVARPSKRIRVDQGRFLACKPTFLEPSSLLKKPVTVTGPVKRLVEKKIDDMSYNYPLVDAQVIYIW
ncbi:Slp family lipoprotein [Marinicella meishanensis]|uniref:Slp family lipoprotein n=1 Tax=Marinicella meishanensis TaxID=2873263 RepID=UPI001CBB28F2|nr:Slp family lipoprotein [Marinicella sp. NBU2979]